MKRRFSLLIVVTVASLILTSCGPTPTPEVVGDLQAQTGGIVHPASIDASKWGDARCNDGSPFGFWLRPSPGSKTWVIMLAGGGLCDDQAVRCSERQPRLKSTPREEALEWMAERSNQGIMNPDPALNPTFHDANKAFGFYCSSDGWSGATTERRPTEADPEGWYFSGRANARAMLEVLKKYYDLNDRDRETKVLFIGCSAGGVGVLANAETVLELLPKTAKRGQLKFLNDAGVVFDRDPQFSFAGTGMPFLEIMRQAYDFWGSSLNSACEAAQEQAGQHPGYCWHLPTVYPFLVEPAPDGLGLDLLVQYSSIDQWKLGAHGLAEDAEGMEKWRESTLEVMDEVDWTWLYSGGEQPYHCALLIQELWSMGPPGQTFPEVLARFWEGSPPEQVVHGNP